MTVQELKDSMLKSNSSSHSGHNEEPPKATTTYLTMMDSILGAFPKIKEKFDQYTCACAEDVYAEVKKKVLGIDVLNGTAKEEKR